MKYPSLFNLLRNSILIGTLFFTIDTIGQSKRDSTNQFLLSAIPENQEFLNLLVDKAYDYYPEQDQFEHNIIIARKQKVLASYDWLNNFLIRGNLNEYTLNPPNNPNGQNFFFPRYNFSLSFTLGTFFSQPLNNKIAKQKYMIAESEKEVYDIHLKTDVLKRYMNFKSLKNIYLIHTKSLDDASTKLALAEDQFKNDQVNYEVYLATVNEVNSQKITTIISERDYEISKIELEELIGQRIEDVIKEYKKSCEY